MISTVPHNDRAYRFLHTRVEVVAKLWRERRIPRLGLK